MLIIIFSFLSALSFCNDHQQLVDLIEKGNYQPRKVFNLCKTKGLDCTYFKAKIFESEGNAGSAMDLYLRGAYYEDYLRLQTYSGAEIEQIIKKYHIDDKKAAFYRGLSEYVKGNWTKAVDFFSVDILKDDMSSKFYLAYSYLMLGNNENAKKISRNRPETINILDQIEYKKLDALVLYAENKQLEAKDLFIDVLRLKPNDFISLKYLAHIYYRTGWFKKAEKIYGNLISKEWRDTELYYLLSERCEMRVRYLLFKEAVKDANKIIKEYPNRKDFIAIFISWLLEHDNLELAKKYAEKLSTPKTEYEKSLFAFINGLLDEFKLNDVDALAYFKKAYAFYPSQEYLESIKTADSNLISMNEDKYPKLDCSKYRVTSKVADSWNIESDIFGKSWPVNYSVEHRKDLFYVKLKIKFIYSSNINFEDRAKVWISSSQNIWSRYSSKLQIQNVPYDYSSSPYTMINILPWPSSFYSKRVTSHEWSVLTPPRTAAHEIGHLLGLDDEYYETDKRIIDRNDSRYIGPRTSLMRNMLSGSPEKRHIHFLLSPIKCN
ncbi:MAG: hypothetical protein WCQ47_05430 [bacterium]